MHFILLQILTCCSAEQVFRILIVDWISTDCNGGLNSCVIHKHINLGVSSFNWIPLRLIFMSVIQNNTVQFSRYMLVVISFFAKKHKVEKLKISVARVCIFGFVNLCVKFRKEDPNFRKPKQVRFLFQEPKENMDQQLVLQVQEERE